MSTTKAMTSFYKRKLPETCVAFASQEGKQIFASALHNQGLKSFFPLIQQFTTQTEPAYCGLSTLVLVLNALAVDPRKNWKGPWRWYEEKMLNCCLDLEDVKQTGITLKDFQCLAHCQGLSVDLKYCDKRSSLVEFRSAVERACVESADWESHESSDEKQEPLQVLVISYSRKIMEQTGSGHFSPIAAYDSDSDSVLILDTARFKYGAHWAKLPQVYEAMKPIDPDTGKSRGFLLLSFHAHEQSSQVKLGAYKQPVSMLFRSKMTQHPARREYKEFLHEMGKDIAWDEVIAYWSEEEGKVANVWSVLEPLRLPEGNGEKEAVQNLRILLKDLLQQADNGPFPCCSDGGDHQRCVSDKEALFVIYLASLSQERRREVVFGHVSDATCTTRENLLEEANLVATAIERSDQSSF